jgi:hypothetical protein
MPHCTTNDKALRQAQDDARYYRERLAETEEAQRRDQEQRWEYEQLRRRERQAEIARSFRQAETWPEALRKQASLCRVEIDPEACGDYFAQMVTACELAGELWTAAEAAAAPAIAELQRQINDLQAQVQRTVAADLAEQSQTSAAQEIAMLMLDPDTDLDEWLNW